MKFISAKNRIWILRASRGMTAVNIRVCVCSASACTYVWLCARLCSPCCASAMEEGRVRDALLVLRTGRALGIAAAVNGCDVCGAYAFKSKLCRAVASRAVMRRVCICIVTERRTRSASAENRHHTSTLTPSHTHTHTHITLTPYRIATRPFQIKALATIWYVCIVAVSVVCCEGRTRVCDVRARRRIKCVKLRCCCCVYAAYDTCFIVNNAMMSARPSYIWKQDMLSLDVNIECVLLQYCNTADVLA